MEKRPLTKQQLADLKEIFVKFDLDGDGSLTTQELSALFRSLGLKPDADQIAALLHKVDKNSNGLIEFPEFLAMVGTDTTEEASYNQEELLLLFRKFDRDGNGYITAVELAHSMARMGHALSVRELTDMIREADTDGDGRISFVEFAEAMTNAASAAW
ncbi:hypothetical protein L7F22_049911 [Adiantum nelumboides]|nr:hypothetical protein [Adiantum nelumboides]